MSQAATPGVIGSEHLPEMARTAATVSASSTMRHPISLKMGQLTSGPARHRG